MKEILHKRTLLKFIDPEKPHIEEGYDGYVVGGSLNYHLDDLDDVINKIKKKTGKKVYIFPGNASTISKKADGVFFISLLNSRDPYWITEVQALGAPVIKMYKLNTLATAYIVLEPGGIASWIADAKPIPQNDPRLAYAYALSAEMNGMDLICFDSGFGTNISINEKLIEHIRNNGVKTPIMVFADEYKKYFNAGANIVVIR